jgi:hypothetical protein
LATWRSGYAAACKAVYAGSIPAVASAAAMAPAAARLVTALRLNSMDEGLPIAYVVLERNVPVYASGGELVGTVDHVVAAVEQDIFHGIVIGTAGRGRRFVAADQVASLHEHGVDLRIDEAEANALPEPHGGAPVYRDNEPGVKPGRWRHFVDTMEGHAARENFKEEK